MVDDAEKRQRALNLKWAPLALGGVLLALVGQPLIPLIDPTFLIVTAICVVAAYNQLHTMEVQQDRTRQNRAWFLLFGISAIVGAGACTYSLMQTLAELRQPCADLRDTLLVEANSEQSDTYQALHCPVTIKLPWKK